MSEKSLAQVTYFSAMNSQKLETKIAAKYVLLLEKIGIIITYYTKYYFLLEIQEFTKPWTDSN